MLNRPENDELNLLVVKAQQGDLISRERLAERIYPVAMVISKRFFEEWSTEHLTRRELAQECCMAFFDAGIRNYKPGKGDLMAYFAGLCVWVGCKMKQASMAGRRGGMIKGVRCKIIRVDGMTGIDDEDAWESIGIEALDRGQSRIDAADSVDEFESRSGANEHQWRVMRLVYEKGMSYREAGEFLGLTVRQVENMLQRLQRGLPYEPKEER